MSKHDRRQMTVRLDPDLAEYVCVWAIRLKMQNSDMINDLIREAIDARESSKKNTTSSSEEE